VRTYGRGHCETSRSPVIDAPDAAPGPTCDVYAS
jgi:hypothetical protein